MSLTELYALTDVVFSAGGPDANSVKAKIDQIVQAQKKTDKKKVNDAAFNTNRFIFQKFKGPQRLAGTNAQVARLISGVFCFAGINITITDPNNSNIIDPSNTTQVVKSFDSTAGTKLPPGSITEPTVLEFTRVVNSFTTPGAGPLNTRLDQYPGFFLIQAGSASGSSGTAVPVIVAICPDASVPASVRARLRLGHERTTGVVIEPRADASFLTCPAPTNLSFLPGWASKALASIMPRTLYAAVARQDEAFRGGVGGTASEFSPFDPIDPELEFTRGGVGGTASEFTITPVVPPKGITPAPSATAPSGGAASARSAPGTTAFTVSPGPGTKFTCTAFEAPWSRELEPECRPRIHVKTHLGTGLNVPVTWTVGLGGGTIARGVQGTTTCTGAFASSITFNTTADSGKAGVCWMLGADLGSYTLVATPGTGDDALAGVTYIPATFTFAATAIPRTPTMSISCPGLLTLGTVVYNGLTQGCNGTAEDPFSAAQLTPVAISHALTATPLTPATPKDVGDYTGTVKYAGAAKYFPNSKSADFHITKATPTVSAPVCPATPVPYTGGDQAGLCTVGIATGVGQDASLPLTPAATLSYALTSAPLVAVTPRDPGNYTATTNYAGNNNYFSRTASSPFSIVKATPVVSVSCANAVETYTGNDVTPACTASATGADGAPLGPAGLGVTYSATPHAPGAYTATGTFAENEFYRAASSATTASFVIKAATTLTIACDRPKVYTGQNLTPCTATVTRTIGNVRLDTAIVRYTPSLVRDAQSYAADASYEGSPLYFGAPPAHVTFQVEKATPLVTVSCHTPVPFTGGDQSSVCSASATGVLGEPLGPVSLNFSPTHPIEPGHYTATAAFQESENYRGGGDVASFEISPPSGFFDGFEAASAWTATGLWNRNTLSGLVNVAYSNFVTLAFGDGSAGHLPSPFTGASAYWYGLPAAGNYLGALTPGGPPGGGGTSPGGANSGTLTSPNIAVSGSLLTTPVLQFDTWWEIEGYQPHGWDIMEIAIQVVTPAGPVTSLGVLNPATTAGDHFTPAIPFTSGGYNAAPVWKGVEVDLSAYRGKTVRIVFSFDTRDGLYNGFRGWIVDNVRVSSAAAALRASPIGVDRVIRELNPVPPVIARPEP